MITKNCLNCGKIFHVEPYRSYRKFCDRYCASNWKYDNKLKLSQDDLRYIACAIDTEGSISLGRSSKAKTHHINFAPHIDIVNTNYKWLTYIAQLLGQNRRKIEVRDRGMGQRIIYSLYIPTTLARNLIPQILPFIIIKRQQAKILLKYWELRKSRGKGLKTTYGKRELKLAEKMREINMRKYGGKFGGVVNKP